MSSETRRVLMAGIDQETLATVRAGLPGDTRISAVSPEAAVPLLERDRFDLIVVAYRAAATEAFARTLRRPGVPSRGAALVVLAPRALIDQAVRLVGSGVNRVLPSDEHPDIIRLSIGRLLGGLGARAARFPASLRLEFDAGTGWQTTFTEDLSASGMRFRSHLEAALGTRIRFRLLPDRDQPISGDAKVMRQVFDATGRPEALAVRFCTFEGDGRALLSRLTATLAGSAR